jgi:hypothetical protein
LEFEVWSSGLIVKVEESEIRHLEFDSFLTDSEKTLEPANISIYPSSFPIPSPKA